jgi:hypothetical protein
MSTSSLIIFLIAIAVIVALAFTSLSGREGCPRAGSGDEERGRSRPGRR